MIAYVSSIHVDPDLAVEIFVMEPLDEPVVLEDHASTDGAAHASTDGAAHPSTDGDQPDQPEGDPA